MANLGSFGAAVRELDPAADADTFEFCGQQFTVHDTIPAMLMMQLGAALTGKVDQQEGLGAIWEAMRVSLTKPVPPATEDDPDPVADASAFQQFYRLAVENHVDTPDLMAVAMALFEAQSGRPTVRRSDSLHGPSTTSTSTSTSSSPPPDLARLRPVASLLAG